MNPLPTQHEDKTPSTFENHLNHILGNCDCDRLDMSCWMMRSNDPDFLHTLPMRQAEAIKQLIAKEVVGPSRYKSQMHSAVHTHSDAGAGYSIGQESMRKEMLEALGINPTNGDILKGAHTGKLAQQPYDLLYCGTCNQMTNHLGGVCQKHPTNGELVKGVK